MLLDCFEFIAIILEEGSVVLFCINECQSPIANRQSLIYNPTNGDKEEKSHEGGKLCRLSLTELNFRKAAEECDNGIENVQT